MSGPSWDFANPAWRAEAAKACEAAVANSDAGVPFTASCFALQEGKLNRYFATESTAAKALEKLYELVYQKEVTSLQVEVSHPPTALFIEDSDHSQEATT